MTGQHPGYDSELTRQRALEFIDWHNGFYGGPPLFYAIHEYVLSEDQDPDDSVDCCGMESMLIGMELDRGVLRDTYDGLVWSGAEARKP